MGAASVVLHDDVAPVHACRREAECDGRAGQPGKAHLIPSHRAR